MQRIFYFLHICIFFIIAYGRRHELKLKNDHRKAVLCSHFGYFRGGQFSVAINHLDGIVDDLYFTLDNAGKNDLITSLETLNNQCFRGDPPKFLYLSFNVAESCLVVHNQDLALQGIVFEVGTSNMDDTVEVVENRFIVNNLTRDLKYILQGLQLVERNHQDQIVAKLGTYIGHKFINQHEPIQQSAIFMELRKLFKSEVEVDKEVKSVLSRIIDLTTPLGSLRMIPYKTIDNKFKVEFTVRFPNDSEAALYNFFFHNCPLIAENKRPVNMSMRMVERNPTSYLSAGQQGLPMLYFVMSLVYLVTAMLWFFYLKLSKNTTFRIHYLMFTVILVKSISLLFHAINYYMIGVHGVHEEGWAVMYYITHIIRGSLLFITILLIGAGWTFIKHMLTPRERNVFLIVIPLQILANVATIVIEESETGTARYATWKDIFIFVDLACCAAILFPVVWSIRHLQAASQVDGKAAINLRNLRMFRHFYIMVICYVYFTRIIAYLLTITVPYSLTWVVELFKEVITWIFFFSVGYKFRPVDDNPYLLVSNDDEDEEDTVMERIQLEDVWSQSGATDGVVRVNRSRAPARSKKTGHATSTITEDQPSDKDQLLPNSGV